MFHDLQTSRLGLVSKFERIVSGFSVSYPSLERGEGKKAREEGRIRCWGREWKESEGKGQERKGEGKGSDGKERWEWEDGKGEGENEGNSKKPLKKLQFLPNFQLRRAPVNLG